MLQWMDSEVTNMIKTAKIINTRGLKGECKLYSYTDDPEHRFEPGRILYLDQDRSKPLEIVKSSMSKGLVFAFFKGIDTVEKAEALKGKDLYIAREDLPETDEDEFYYHELAGCQVYNEANEDLGKVTDILETGPNLVLRVSDKNGNFLVPFVDQFIVSVDKKDKVIVIREMEGLR